jgi:hypothetical protein
VSLRKVEVDHLRADLATVEELLQSLDPDDIVGRLSLTARKDALVQESHEAERSREPGARTVLVFDGDPVRGGRGIDANFAGKIVSEYEDLVTKTWAFRFHGDLASGGPVPERHRAALHVTDVIRGSFGFALEELTDDDRSPEPALEEAVAVSTRAIVAATEGDDALADAAADLGERAFGSLRDFFAILRKHGAALRIASHDVDRRLGLEVVVAAAERTEASIRRESKVMLSGEFLAVLPGSRHFEFRDSENRILKGRVTDELTEEDLKQMNRAWSSKRCRGEFTRVTVTRSGKERHRYVLDRLLEEEP